MRLNKTRIIGLVCFFVILFGAPAPAAGQYDDVTKYPPRLRRSESFLGIHFDFHANNNDKEIGKTVTPEMVQAIIDKVHPDYIQIDCKGHSGYSSYPTKVGNQAGGFVGDPLRIWREVTAQNGVALYMHYSGVWDTKAVTDHPEWARVDENGKPDPLKTSVFGPYVDELMIPQLCELAGEYGVDGYWIDGECWALKLDYRPDVLEKFKKDTGITDVPKKFEDPYWYEFGEFNREGFRNYVRHYTSVLHERFPDIQIASNWAFSSLMPEPVTIDVDFLSGDYPMQDSVNSGRLEARCLRMQGMPWDLMAWGFSTKWAEMGQRSIKSPKQLKREASIVLSTGGGFQAYFYQNRDGSIHDWHMNVMGEVAKFCRARQEWCHRAESVPQVAVLYSREDLARRSGDLYVPGGHLQPLRGVLFAILENQYHADLTMEHHLRGQMEKYPVIVIAEWQYLDDALQKELVAYARGGGSLLLIGARPVEMFEEHLGLSSRKGPEKKTRWIEIDGVMAGIATPMHTVTLESDAESIGTLYTNDEFRGQTEIPASVRPFGKGKIGAIYMNIGERYHNARTAVLRDFVGKVMHEMLPEPIVEVSGSHDVDVVVNRNHGKLQVNLINTAGPHANKEIYTFDDFPAVGPLKVRIRLDEKPVRISREPGSASVDFTWNDGIAEMLIPRLEIHDILVVHQEH